MGWSCSDAAGKTMDRWVAKCRKETKQSNVFEVNRVRYFWEEDREEFEDGSIKGEVFMQLNADRCRSAGRFHIGGDGNMVSVTSPALNTFISRL